jgi:hypothetical protein
MKIELDCDTIDDIMRNALVHDYIWLTDDIKKATKYPEYAHEEDLEAWVQVAGAIEVLGAWYCINFKDDVKKARKKK